METQRIFICGEIGYWWASYQKESIFHAQAAPLDVFIDSQGGSVYDGTSFAALLRDHAVQHAVEVRTIGLGVVASIATAILLAGTKVEMDENCMLMIHNPAVGWFSGGADELRQTADTLDNIKEMLVNMYVKRIIKSGKGTEKTRKQVIDWMDKETTMTAEQALERGFIDAIKAMPTEAQQAATIIDELPEVERIGYQNFLNKLNTKPTIKNMALDKEIEDKITALEENQKGFLARMTDFFSNIFVKPTAPAAPGVVAPVAPATEVATPVINNEAVTLKAQLEEQAQKMKELEQRNAELQTKAPVVQNSDVPEESNEPNNKAMQKLKGFQALVKTCPTLHNAIKTTYGK